MVTDTTELAMTEQKVGALLRRIIDHNPRAPEMMIEITTFGHAIIDQTGTHDLGDILERIVKLDAEHATARHRLLETAWEHVGVEGDEQWL